MRGWDRPSGRVMRDWRQDWRQAATSPYLVATKDTNINDSGGLLLATRVGDNLSPSLFNCSTRQRNSPVYHELQPATSWRPIGDKTPPLSLERGS